MNPDKVYLVYIQDCITSIEELVQPGRSVFDTERHYRAAALYYLHTMAESTQRLSEDTKAEHTEIDWKAIGGFRNRLVHGYPGINIAVVWDVIENYLL